VAIYFFPELVEGYDYYKYTISRGRKPINILNNGLDLKRLNSEGVGEKKED
jgi:hypothetical protein